MNENPRNETTPFVPTEEATTSNEWPTTRSSSTTAVSVDTKLVSIDCYDLMMQSSEEEFESGVHHSFGETLEASALCHKDGWMVVQSRGQFGNAIDSFYRSYDNYVKGFGVPGLCWKKKEK